MREHEVRTHPPGRPTPREEQLAWKLAALAADRVPEGPEVVETIINRLIDNAGVAVAALNRAPVASARAQALAHPRPGGATVFGLSNDVTVHCEWAAWANGAAVRELDFHDNFFALESSHPGDTIPPLLAVAQQCRRSGRDLVRAVATAYEVQVDLAKGIPLNPYRIDHIAHLGPAQAAGLCALLDLPVETAYQAIQHAAHVSVSTRQARKGAISSWKAHAPGHVGKLAIEAVDRAMRGETSPSPAYEGEYGLIAQLLGGPEAAWRVPLPDPGESKRAILETFTKEYSAGYHGQAAIDLAFRMRERIGDPERIERIVLHTKRLSHLVMGAGANDPEKWDPDASRETLDHSLMFIFAVALQDGTWHHERSYAPERVRRPDTVRLWRQITTVEDPDWNRRYDGRPPLERDHGMRAVVTFTDGTTLSEEIAVADAHPRGARPFRREDYVRKYTSLAEGVVEPGESERFLDLVRRLPELEAQEIRALNVQVDPARLGPAAPSGIF
ncbi:MAG: 2-methylcitrate dehydratase [Rhodospirillales bacterium]|nr:2-methylcitrate dehydratase [Rhodospirillales bacterium]